MKLTKFRKKNSKVVHLDLYFQEHFGIKKELVTCDLVNIYLNAYARVVKYSFEYCVRITYSQCIQLI